MHRTRDEITFANKIGDKAAFRSLVDFGRAANLQHIAAFHHRDAVAHRQGFFLIVGDENERNAESLLNVFQFKLHFFAKLGVQGRQWFIQQQHFGLVDQSAGQCDALLLTAGKLFGFAAGEIGQLHHIQRFLDALGGFAFANALHLQAKRHVFGDRHMRKQRVALEHGVNIALMRRRVAHWRTVNHDLAAGWHFKARDHPQQSGFATTRWPQQGKKFAVRDFQRNITNGSSAAKLFGKMVEFNRPTRITHRLSVPPQTKLNGVFDQNYTLFLGLEIRG